MRATINGLRYDTAKATLIGEAGAAVMQNDSKWWAAGLYRSPRAGRYFLAGQGGPMTRWARKIEQSWWSGGSGIVPLTREEALEWAAAELTPAEVDAGFAEHVQDA